MKSLRTMALALLTVSLAAAPAFGASIGDPAAPLAISKWIQGGPVDLKAGKGKNVFVVEFWATWCFPCLETIPHLSELQQKYKEKGFVAIGISDEKAQTVQAFVQNMGDKMNYVVALDDKLKTKAAYMDAFGQASIPMAFVVDRDGVVAWVGHPFAGLDAVLEQVIEGTYDIEARKRLAAAKENLSKYFTLVVRGDKADAKQLGESIVKDAGKDIQILNGMAWLILTIEGLPYRDLDLAMRAAKAAYDASNGQDPFVVDTYARAMYESGDVAKAIEYQEKAVALAPSEAERDFLSATLNKYLEEAGQTQ